MPASAREVTVRRLWLPVVLGVVATVVAARLAAQPPGKPPDKATEPAPATILGSAEAPIDLATALRLAGAENTELLLARQRNSEAAAGRQFATAQHLQNLKHGTNYKQHRG